MNRSRSGDATGDADRTDPGTPGPAPERLRIEAHDWGDAVRDALRKGKPPAANKAAKKAATKKGRRSK
jgi:hypothetical protein